MKCVCPGGAAASIGECRTIRWCPREAGRNRRCALALAQSRKSESRRPAILPHVGQDALGRAANPEQFCVLRTRWADVAALHASCGRKRKCGLATSIADAIASRVRGEVLVPTDTALSFARGSYSSLPQVAGRVARRSREESARTPRYEMCRTAGL